MSRRGGAMYFIKISMLLLVSVVSVNSHAFESAMKPHAMVYLTIPLDRTNANQDKFNLGFRIDNVAYTPGEPVNYQALLQHRALIDFRIDNKGLDGIFISGTDYVQLYKVSRQNEDQGSAVTEGEEPAESTTEADAEEEIAAEAEVEEEEEDEDDGLTVGDRVKGVIADMRSVAPMGVYMGAALGIGLLLGVDD